MRKIISLTAIILAVACLFASCGSPAAKTVPLAEAERNRSIIGPSNAKHTFIWEIVEIDGTTIHSFIIKTDQDTPGKALQEIGYVSFTKAEKKTVIGINGYELAEGAEWFFYVNGELSKEDARRVKITDNAVYSFAQFK